MIRRVKLKPKDAAAVEEFVERIRSVLGNNVVEVKLFGSKATGKDQPGSDIDVLVAVEEGGVEVEDEVLDIAFETNLKHEVYISPRVISVTFTNHQGFIRSLSMPHKVEHLVNYVRKHFTDHKVAFVYEAGPTGYGLYDGLVAQAYPRLIVAPSMIPRAPGQRVKTNRLDSRALSENLRGGQLKSSTVEGLRTGSE